MLFDEAPVDHLPPNRRGVGIVFQNYALFPHMTVRQNVAYGLQAHHWPRDKIAPRVDEMLDLVHMRQFGDRLPRQLSGGQQQRIALARCLAIDPKVLLLDEPFGALDKNLRLDMQIEVKRLHREYGITTILVTHDQEEALSMADRIAVMNRGRIEQVASPTDIYDRPATLFVNQFVGTTNLIPGKLVATDAGGCGCRNSPAACCGPRRRRLLQGADVLVSVRPEQMRVQDDAGAGCAFRHRQDGDAARTAGDLRRRDRRRHGDQDQPVAGIRQRAARERKHHSVRAGLRRRVPRLSAPIRLSHKGASS